YVIAEPCVDLKDKACIEECPVDCIYEGKRSLYIHPDECVDCGACEPVCPVEAIFYEDDTPAQWKDYYRANVDFFTETTSIGSPGGAEHRQQGDGVPAAVVARAVTRHEGADPSARLPDVRRGRAPGRLRAGARGRCCVVRRFGGRAGLAQLAVEPDGCGDRAC